jgi:hypothetical protein
VSYVLKIHVSILPCLSCCIMRHLSVVSPATSMHRDKCFGFIVLEMKHDQTCDGYIVHFYVLCAKNKIKIAWNTWKYKQPLTINSNLLVYVSVYQTLFFIKQTWCKICSWSFLTTLIWYFCYDNRRILYTVVANDYELNELSLTLQNITNFIRKNNRTNIILMNVPFRYDLPNSVSVNRNTINSEQEATETSKSFSPCQFPRNGQ